MKRSLLFLAGATAAALVLSGCSASEDAASASGTVNFLGPEDPATFAPIIDAFEAEHPDITITYTQVPFDQYSSTLQQRLGAKDDSIDVYAVDQPNISQIAAQGFLEDLSDLQDEAQAATSPAMYETNVYEDKLWALSIWNSTQMLFFNRDALTAAGIDAPSVDPADRWTWEQVADAGRATQEGGMQYGLLFEQVEAYYQLQPLAESLGGGSGITGDDMLSVDVTNDGWEEAMTWYGDTFASGLSPRGVGGFQTSPVFMDGNVTFFVGGPWDVGRFSADVDFDWGVAPMPSFDGGEIATPTGSWSWGINTASKNKDAARQFLEFAALNPAGNLATVEVTASIPANSEAAAEFLPGFEEQGGEHSAGVADLITYEVDTTAVARPVSVGYVQFESAMNKAFADIRNGSPAADRLEQATAQIEDAWSNLR
ncbi:sugar ABC transporter substrate-binding protein [Microbacterium hominis]|uniref:Sugar ABC transporter substrate-binding protein n=1 Tax=Microbacterium hominis TaxID=162426 RepID=A0A7D4UFP7_9MICO|nr:sugar ABC transporter substrate-binding protein [Microbacterium hominis]QKJ18569.1 sugar ABC transporter substrate-binding protein [Microbacterium hominis]